jgi:aryl-alcohol dehydrogenase-like predicted oxidoreductase
MSWCAPAWYASRAQAIAEFRGYKPVTSLQVEYSVAKRSVDIKFTVLATRHEMGLMARSPLARGLLS